MREGPGIQGGYVHIQSPVDLSHEELADRLISTSYSTGIGATMLREEAARRLRALAVLIPSAS
jgi:hypothetical protein